MAGSSRQTTTDVFSRDDLSLSGSFQVRPPESRDERVSRLRREEATARFAQIKESILLGVVCVVAIISLIGSYAPWIDIETRGKAAMLLATIVSGAGTYLFTRPQVPSK